MQKYDLVIIGGGAGGLVVASVAAQLGLNIALVEKEKKLGGDCLHFGCVPSKALLRTAHVAHLVNHAEQYGVNVSNPASNIQAINQYISRAVETIQVHDSHERFKTLGCDIYTGSAKFLDASKIQVAETELSAKRFVIATGSRPWIPPVPGLEKVPFLTNENMYSLNELPAHLVIMGAGPVGVEMAQAYIRHGSRVTLIELAQRVLPRADPEMSQVLHDQLSADGVEILTGSSVETVAQQGDNIMLQLQDGQLIEGDKLLVAIGRRPAVSDLGLEAAGIEYNTQGIIVNSRMQTSRRHIYACGDVTGQMPLTHVAEQQAGVVIANAIFHLPKKMDYRVIPSVVYTEPECAQVGAMTDVAEDDPAMKVVKFGMDLLDRAIADNSTRGFIKLVVRKGRLIGAHAIGQHAGEVIHELALAIQQNMKLSKITTLVHAYPTYSQVNRRVASQYYSGSLFSPATRKLVKFINRWLP